MIAQSSKKQNHKILDKSNITHSRPLPLINRGGRIFFLNGMLYVQYVYICVLGTYIR